MKKDIPANIKWLLKFANLSCTPGTFNLKRQIRFYTLSPKIENLTFPVMPGLRALIKSKKRVKIKRLPIEPSTIKKGISPLHMRFIKAVGNIRKDDCRFQVTPKGEIVFAGEHDYLPKITDFKSFFYKHGIPPQKRIRHLNLKGNMDAIIPKGAVASSIKSAITKGAIMPLKRKEPYIYLNNFFQTVLCFLWDIMTGESESHIVSPNGFITDLKTPNDFVYKFYTDNQNSVTVRDLVTNNVISFDHDNSLPLAICAFLLDFKYNHNEFHSKLTQCECCASFLHKKKW